MSTAGRAAPAGADPGGARRAGPPADPVRELMERHRPLVETAVHPLEVAAALEAEGIGPGIAARFRHPDVFSLADELFARVPRRPAGAGERDPVGPWDGRALRALGTGLAAGLASGCYAWSAPQVASHQARYAGAAVLFGVLAALAFHSAASPLSRPRRPFLGGRLPGGMLRGRSLPGRSLPGQRGGGGGSARPVEQRTPLARSGAVGRIPGTSRRDVRPPPPSTGDTPGAEVRAALLPGPAALGGRDGLPTRCCYALGVAVLLGTVTVRVPFAPGANGAAMSAALATGFGSADWVARWFARLAWGHLGAHRGRAEFRARMRPVLPVALACQATALAVFSFAALLIAEHGTSRPGMSRPSAGPGRAVAAAVAAVGGTAWAAQALLGTVLLGAALLRRCGHPRSAALATCMAGVAGVAATVTGAAAAQRAVPGRWSGLLGPAALPFAAAGLVALLLPYVWVVLLRPGAHRTG